MNAALPAQTAIQAEFLTVRRLGALLTVLGLVIAPHALHTQPWIIAAAFLLGLWRYGAARFGWRLPGKALRLVLALLGFLGVFASYRSLGGVEAGSALLILMLALKLTETWRRRDCLLLVLLGYFLVMAELLYEQSILVTLYLIPVTWVLTSVFLELTHTGAQLSFRTAMRFSGRLLLFALPLMLIMFVLFPRVPGPLWGVQTARGEAVSGLDDKMAPGSISSLSLSNEVAFRVAFAGEMPPPAARYWRGPVLHHFDGRTWEQGWTVREPGKFTPAGAHVEYTVTLEPHERHWLFALELPLSLPDEAFLAYDYELLARRPVRERQRYTIRSTPRYQAGTELDGWQRRRDLQVPEDFNPRTLALAAEWRATLQSDRAIVRRALQMFRTEPFVYTLQPPLLGRDSMDEFLFETRRGFCEHYASALTLLMRAAGIPARVVTGYQGGDTNPLGDYLIVRQSSAHAWTEVWFDDSGWVRVDPTAAVAPERIEFGLASALSEGESLPGSAFRDNPLLLQLELTWDMLNANWNEWILGYGPELQRDLLSFAGFDNPTWEKMAALMTGLLILTTAVIAAWLSWNSRRHRPEPLVRLYRQFCAKLERVGIVRHSWEGPLDFARRAEKLRPEIATEIRLILQLYSRLRYGRSAHTDAERTLRERVRNFRVA